ncbi:MAG: HAD hydrolase-like protein [Pseudomonadota bacterium]
MTRLAKFGSLPWDCILGAEVAGNYKPHPDSYLKSVAALSLAPEDVVMVAAHNSDLHAARECGLQTAFIPRPTEYGSGQSIDLEPNSDWDYVVETIGELASI